MAAAASYVVQPFNRETVLKPGALRLCRTEEEARRIASTIVGSGHAHGAVVMSRTSQDLDEATAIIACEGEVPYEATEIWL